MLTLANEALLKLFDFPALIFTIGGAVFVVYALTTMVTSIFTTRSFERTRREIAAYVAEGSLDADKAVAMLNAGNDKSDGSSCCG
jgi:hypothetical protein